MSAYQDPNVSQTVEQLRLSDAVVAIAANSSQSYTVNTASQGCYGIQTNLLKLVPLFEIVGLANGDLTLEARVDGKLLQSQAYTANGFVKGLNVETEISKAVVFTIINSGDAIVTIKQNRILVQPRVAKKVC